MKPFEIRTPALREAMDAFRIVLSGRQDGSMERDQARDMVAAGNGIVRTVGQELKVRTVMPKIAAQEARLIEGERSDSVHGAGGASALEDKSNPQKAAA